MSNAFFNTAASHISLCTTASYLGTPTSLFLFLHHSFISVDSVLPVTVFGASCWNSRGFAAVLGPLWCLGMPLCIPQHYRGCLYFKTLLVETKEPGAGRPGSQTVQEGGGEAFSLRSHCLLHLYIQRMYVCTE